MRRSRLISNVSYQVGLDLTWKPDLFRSGTLVRFRGMEPGAEIFLDLAARRVERIELNGRPLPPETLEGNCLRLPNLRRDNEVLVLAECPYADGGGSLHRFLDPTDGRLYCFRLAEPQGTHRVHACFDEPDLRATFELGVRVPAGSVVISNSHVAHRPPPASAGWWILAPTPPLPPSASMVAAGPFASVTLRHRTVDLSLHCRQSLLPDLEAAELLAVTAAGLDLFERLFDAPCPWGRSYDQIFVPEELSQGQQEDAGCTTISEAFVFRSGVTDEQRVNRAETILQKMALLWSGQQDLLEAVQDCLHRHALATATLHDFLAALPEIARGDLQHEGIPGLTHRAPQQAEARS